MLLMLRQREVTDRALIVAKSAPLEAGLAMSSLSPSQSCDGARIALVCLLFQR